MSAAEVPNRHRSLSTAVLRWLGIVDEPAPRPAAPAGILRPTAERWAVDLRRGAILPPPRPAWQNAAEALVVLGLGLGSLVVLIAGAHAIRRVEVLIGIGWACAALGAAGAALTPLLGSLEDRLLRRRRVRRRYESLVARIIAIAVLATGVWLLAEGYGHG